MFKIIKDSAGGALCPDVYLRLESYTRYDSDVT